MSDDVSDIAFFYNSAPEREHSRLGEHQLEYDLTWRYLDRYLPTHGSILEVGAATGRYTLDLAKWGYTLIWDTHRSFGVVKVRCWREFALCLVI